MRAENLTNLRLKSGQFTDQRGILDMTRGHILVLCLLLLVVEGHYAVLKKGTHAQTKVGATTPLFAGSVDGRDVVRSGIPISSNASQYYNQPQAVQLANGSWLLVITNAPYTEGDPRQRVVSLLHPSPDLTLGGWQPQVIIEDMQWGPSAGWVVPLYAPALGRVYAMYTFNADNITTVPPGSPSSGARNKSEYCRCNLLGGQWFRYTQLHHTLSLLPFSHTSPLTSHPSAAFCAPPCSYHVAGTLTTPEAAGPSAIESLSASLQSTVATPGTARSCKGGQ
jgi:hypothetical protein